MKKTLFEMRKGREMRGSGSWQVTKREDLTIKVIAAFFAVHVIGALILAFMRLNIAAFFFIMSFVWMFIMMGYMFWLVYKKNREKPMDVHYYDVDHKYNGIKNKTADHTKEITEEEFKNRE